MNRLLGDISSTIDYGVTASAVDSPVGPKFLRITDIQDGAVNWNNVPWCNCSEREAASCQLQDGDIVFARTGATTGKSFLIREAPSKSAFASYLIRVRLGKDANPLYVSQFFNSPSYWRQITGRARGVAQPGVNSTSLKTLEVPLPPLAEQKRIAGILDAADALRAKRREALAQLDSLLQATFDDLFGDPVTNPKGWNIRKLGEGARFHAGSTLPDSMPYAGQDGGFLSLKVSDLNLPENATNVAIAQLWTAKSTGGITAPPKSVLIPKRGGAIGTNKKRLLSRPAVLDPNLMAISAGREIHYLYLYRWFHTFDLATLTSGSSVPQLNKRDLSPLDIQTPPLSVQEQFAKVVESIAHQRVTLNAHLAELDKLFASLQSRAFRGEL